ncbi:MAG TPA: amino acid adenylation domain-containing protein, partial [Polyangiales bacterium]|nr:amino acid adenylation domain-containing protein [Polyangiales bacterium]
IQRLLDRTALFETAFNFVHFHQYQELLAGGLLRALDYESHENTAFAVMVNFVLHPGTGRLELHLQYDTQRVAAEQAEQIARGHVLALEHMLRDPEAKLGSAGLIDAPERAVLERWSLGQPASEVAPLHVLFENQVARTPEAPALQYDRVSLSYSELDGWANHVARELLTGGVHPGEVVAICAEPSLQRAAAVLGVLKAGCTCLPLDAQYPTERLTYMLERAGCRRALATRQHATAAFLRDQQVWIVERPTAAAAPGIAVGVRDPAYIIFTSGSTGRPKGILMPHEPLAKLVMWHVSLDELPLGATTVQHSLFGFDVSLQEMFSTWASGGRLVMVPEPARKDARQLAKLLAQEHVARLFVPVVALHQLTEVAEQLQLALPDLREVNSAGEQLEITAAVRAFFERHPRCRLHNQYGPSETHVATTYRLPVDPTTWPITPGVGLPGPGIRAYVLDDARQPTPIGVPGELFLAGSSVGLGYCNDPAQTAERFLTDPHGERMYQTGDLLRWLPDGHLEYCGRRDSQLKIRGYRVELGEIESALVAVSEGRVQRAVVLAVAGRSKAQRHELVAYVVPSAGESVDASQLRAALGKRLPSYMLPSALHVLEALPTAPSGKIDRHALASLAPLTAAQAPAKVAPCSALETELCGLWQEVLDVREAELGVTDDFFASGGDSLGAVRLMARIQRRYGVELPISALIEAPTVRELARVLAAAGPATRAPTLVHLGGAGPRTPIFCVHPIGGHVLCYAQLARRLGEDQPFYGIQARGLTGSDQPHTSVVEMASAYAAEITSVQPHGTVQLAGWSFGGAVALEIARQLQRAGRAVAPVVILDSMAKASSVLHMSEDDLFEFVAMELFGVSIEDADIEAVLSRDIALDRNARLLRLAALVRARRGLPEGADLSQLEHVIAVIRSNIQAVYDHQPRRYDGPVVLLRCTDPMPDRLQRLHELAGTTYRDPSNGWAEYCPQLEIIPVAGDHVSIVFEPHVATVAQVLRRIAADGAASWAAE